MKKTRLFGAMMCGLLAAGTLTSCLNDKNSNNEPNSFTAQLPSSMNITAVKDASTNTWSIYDGSAITFMYDFSVGTVGLTVSGMQITPESKASFSIPRMPLAYSQEGAFVSSVTGPYNISLGATTSMLTNIVTYLHIPDNCPSVVNMSLIVDDRYKVDVVPTVNYFGGTTRIVNTRDENAQPYTNTRTYYNLYLDGKTKKAELLAHRAKFAENMDREIGCLSWPGLDFDITDSGIVFHADAVVPEIITFKNDGTIDSRTPQPQFACTDVSGVLQVAKSLTFTYDCTAMGNASFSGSPLTKFVE